MMRRTVVAILAAVLAVSASGPAEAGGKKRYRPTVGFETADGAVLLTTPAESDLSVVRGWAEDNASGVRRVVVTYCPGSKGVDGSWTCGSTGSAGSPTRTRAALTCSSTRRTCTWTASAPQQPGRYLVFARATDRAGYRRSVGPIQVHVV